MSSGLRLAVPPHLHAPVSAACARLALGGRTRVVSLPPAREERLERRWQRLLAERSGGHGIRALAAAVGDPLHDPSVRAVLALLDHEADAAVISESDPGWRLAWHLLEPAPAPAGGICADAYLGQARPDAVPFAWLDWPGAYPLSTAVERLRVVAAWRSGAGNEPSLPVVVSFSGGPNPLQGATDRFRRTLVERATAAAVELYSPLFYTEGRLQAAAVLAAIERQLPPRTAPVVCCPQLARLEWVASLESTDGVWAGPFRAGGERPLARLAPGDSPARLAATLAWLAR